MLLRVFFTFFLLCLHRRRSLWEWLNAAPLYRQLTESWKSHPVSNLACHWHKGWREQVHELSPMNSKWGVCKTRLLIIDLYKLLTVSQVAQEPQKNCLAHSYSQFSLSQYSGRAKPFKNFRKFPKSPIRPAGSRFYSASCQCGRVFEWTLTELRFNIIANLLLFVLLFNGFSYNDV